METRKGENESACDHKDCISFQLYTKMTQVCIEEVAMPMRRLKLLDEEFATLKIILFCQFSALNALGRTQDSAC